MIDLAFQTHMGLEYKMRTAILSIFDEAISSDFEKILNDVVGCVNIQPGPTAYSLFITFKKTELKRKYMCREDKELYQCFYNDLLPAIFKRFIDDHITYITKALINVYGKDEADIVISHYVNNRMRMSMLCNINFISGSRAIIRL